MAQPLVKKDDDRDEEADYSPFLGIEKGAVLQEARVFHDPQLDARRCSQIEATEVFFAVTKLFQSKDIGLRRMVYLMIKELSPSADEVIIVTSSLMKDMNSRTDLFRANAIRVLCRITDGTLLAQIERYLKQAIVDKNPVVASAALVSGIHLLQTNPEIVRRWSNEVQEAVQSRAALVQFHALALLHQVIKESGINSQAGERPFYDYLEGCLRHKAEVVIFEAARTITELSNVTTRELTPAITVLQLFLSSSKPVLRFSALRTLNKVAMTHPMAVTNCNIDMESLISDQNRSIATLAITTLLKTGNESSVDRLMKQITNFMSDIADEFKIVVVEAIRSLCLKFPLKYRSLMNFLSNILREEGGFEYKKAIVDSIVILIRDIPDAKERIAALILHFLGNEGPKTSDPSKYIRYIYNRVILENATVRASAVSTLAKFGALVDSLKPRIFVLLRRCVFDNDDEVTVIVDASDAEEFSEVGTKPLRSLPYDTPGQTFVAFEKPEGVPADGKFSNVLRFTVKEVDPSTGESEDDGVEDEYQLEDFEVVAADYILKVGVSNFKNAWESLGPDGERIDEYGLGPRESLAEAVSTVINLLGMQPCEGTEVVPSNSRSHTCLLSGIYIGNVKVLVRLSFGIDGAKEVAMKLAVRSEDENVSEAIHEIVASGISRELEARKNELDDLEKQLMERGASTENNRLKLKYEKKKHDRAVLNKKKAKKALRLAERYKREKVGLRRKIIQLKVKFDDKPLLEMELIYLRGQTEIVKFTGNYVDVDKLYALLRELHEKEVELYDLEALNHALIVKERKSNGEIQEAQKELITIFRAQSCEGQLESRNGGPIDKTEKSEKELRKDAYEAMGTALMEGDACSPRGSYPLLELCNYKEQRRATLKEAISYLIKQWSMLKKKEALDADAREGEGLKEEEASDADAGEGEELKKEEPLAADAGEGKERGTKKGY
ncbi:UNVERIFIED_CONTAM: Coatomer subunit gamma-2 [Sesamum angustifolium]|uniref:Coatomer subunit gamma-2 n=1 Tax=Sesamum angustifolium TaxID=2727405 RepID=A0AAW2QD49_9LAMI